MSRSTRRDDHLNVLESAFSDSETAARVRSDAPGIYDAVDGLWTAICSNSHLSPRMRELIILARSGASSALNTQAIERHARRALLAGASKADIADVLATIIPMANHPLYKALPILLDEMKKAGLDAEIPPLSPELRAIKEDFVAKRNFWVEYRDVIGGLMPDYFKGFTRASLEPWKTGSLSPKERELVYIAVDSAITHVNEPGIRTHVKEALRYGATRDELLAVFQLASLIGLEGYVLATGAVASNNAT